MSLEAVEFRPATPLETEELALVMARANAQRDGQPLPEAGDDHSQQFIESRQMRAGAWTQLASCDGKIAGFALSHPLIEAEKQSQDPNTEHLSLLMIDPDYWGKRIASRLLDLTAGHARAADRRYVTLWTREANNSRARELYTHKGFNLTGTRRLAEDGMQVHYRLSL